MSGSYITPATVQAIAHSLDIPHLSDEAAKALAPDVEYRLREVIQVRRSSGRAAALHPLLPLLAAALPASSAHPPACTSPTLRYPPLSTPQEALKFAKHAKRVRLTTEDVNNALRLKNAEVRCRPPLPQHNSRPLPAKC